MIEHLFEIEEHFRKEYPKEGCGLLAVSKGKLNWIPCTNVAEGDQDFVIDSQEYIQYNRTMDIVGVVHSHPDASCKPSESDINYCNALGIPYYIFSYPEMDMTLVEPKTNVTDLYGREYSFGTQDCFEAAKDYLKTKNIEIPNRLMWEDDWWEKGLNYFSEEILAEWNFYPVEDMQPNDLILFSVKSDVPNHCGVCVSEWNSFYHHAVTRLSCRESLYPIWNRYISGIYRYEA